MAAGGAADGDAAGDGGAAGDGERRSLSRRDALIAAGALAIGAAAGTQVPRLVGTPAGAGAAPQPVDPTGEHQAGVARPATPQPHTLVAVADFPETDAAAAAAALPARLDAVSAAVLTLAAEPPEGAPDLTATVGLGPRIVAALDASLPGAHALPAFAGDDGIADARSGGDLLVSVCGSHPAALGPALDRVLAAAGTGPVRWQQLGFRAPGEGTVARNPLGFHDGVIVPRGESGLDENVWIADGAAAGGTVCVIRQLRLDVARFGAQSVPAQEAVIGRRKADGAPLSGGGPRDEANLRSKAPDGELLVPLRSHVRAAHPSFTGSHLMLRRGYAYANGPAIDASGARVDDQGLLFICFQRELDDFVRTQRRLDEADDLMGYATPVASGSFLVLPGFTADAPLGSTLAG